MKHGGVLLIDKPTGPTSHDVVQKIRRKLHIRRVGHAGTLDPLASGLLVVCVSDATRVLEYLTAWEKGYTGEVVFGIGTDTDDADGKVVTTASIGDLNDSQVADAARKLTGTIQQTVPAYSAVHVNGKRAYELARAGEEVDMPSREVHISSFRVGALEIDGDVAKARFEVVCSKGTYIRALCRDLGELLNLPAHMASLRRTSVGVAKLADAVTLDAFLESDDPLQFLSSPLAYLSADRQVTVSRQVIERLANGQQVSFSEVPMEPAELNDDDIVFISFEGDLAAVASVTGCSDGGQLKPKKVFWKRG
ncbi:tRNA pseudouridine(55) synthase TruB [Alicyclobacillus dauci]|uniref:tRNA pseudouridine synthase B n=1 Tax=Alicyclobacillus dauci TaxID=1475485 RepID=A0ABY6YXN2_9BACL|nr:tRNA pseudouridine(55) synthase TruB [Alicyclobacillus dauci]WAH35363.1 tRNA pseudouridine(55) synthase TruB [Alicyclobacillus dauci]